MRHSIFIFALFVSIVGCESTDIVDLPHQEPRIVINSAGLNDNLFRARVTASEDVLSLERVNHINDATVNIYENDAFVETLTFIKESIHDEQGQLYKAAIAKPTPGNIYKITATSPGYPPVEAEYLQPDIVEVEAFEITVLGPIEDWRSLLLNEALATVGFTDPPGPNYYEILMSSTTDTTKHSFFSGGGELQFIDPAYKQDRETRYGYDFQVFDDTYFEGQPVKFDFQLLYFTEKALGGPPVETRFKVYLRNITKDYYQYLKTTSLQVKTSNDPFAQPVIIHSNITNGYGIFGGYTQATKEIVVPND